MNDAYSKGFSLIEVLLAVVVLALGVTGAAGMQLAAHRTTQQSGLQGVALQLATELADRIRGGDWKQVIAAPGNPFTGLAFDAGAPAPPPAPVDCYGEGAICDARQAAAFDLRQWLARVSGELPHARVAICRDAQPWDAARDAYKWECDGGDAASLVIKIGWQQKNPDGALVRAADRSFAPAIAMTVAPYPQ